MDLKFAIATMVESFIQCQDDNIGGYLSHHFGKYRVLASGEEFFENILVQLMK